MLQHRQTLVDPVFPETGALFAGRYRIDSLLGLGGFSRVYRGKQAEIDRDVAIKVMASGRTGTNESWSPVSTIEKRFYREARLLSRLHSPNTIRMFDYGRTSDGLLFMIFEFVDGRDLSKVISEESPLSSARCRCILTQVLESLREAHHEGILHRDIKPGNIMVYDHLGELDRVKVLDFGIAKSVAAEAASQANLTMEGAVIGTPRYMSPEQATGRPLDMTSDLFSVGLVAFEMLIGRPAVESGELSQAQQQLLRRKLRLPAGLDVDGELRDVVNRLLETEKSDRFPSASAVLATLGEEASAEIDHSGERSSQADDVFAYPLFLDSSGLPPAADLTASQELDLTVRQPPTAEVSKWEETSPPEETSGGPRHMRLAVVAIGAALLGGMIAVAFFAGRNTGPTTSDTEGIEVARGVESEAKSRAGAASDAATVRVFAALTAASRVASSAAMTTRQQANRPSEDRQPATEEIEETGKRRPKKSRKSRPDRRRRRPADKKKETETKPTYDFKPIEEL